MSTRQILEVDVIGRDTGFSTMLNRVNTGVSRFSQGFRQGSQQAGIFSNQIKAIGTTARYYLAGSLVYGVASAVRSLGDFKTQLGEVNALAAASASQSGSFSGLGGQLQSVGQDALLMSNKFGIAVTEVETYMQRFYTAFKPTGTAQQQAKQMEDFVNAHLNLVTVLGGRSGDPNQLAGGVAAIAKGLPYSRTQPGRAAETIGNYLAKIVTSAPQLQGSDVATAAGRLRSIQSLARMNTLDTLSVYGLAAQAGGSPSVIGRGITQLLGQSLLHPTRPESLAVYRQAQLPTDPNQLAQMGGWNVLAKLIQFANPSGTKGGKNQPNLDAIYGMFSRNQSVQQFVNILADGGVPALRKFREELVKAQKEQFNSRIANIRLQSSVLMRMGTARSNLGLALVSGADWPLEHGLADPLIGLSNAAIKHPRITQGVVGGALTLGALSWLRKLGAFGGLGKWGRFGKGINAATDIEQAALSGAITKSELPSALANKADGTPGSPYWVVISPMSWNLGSPGFGSSTTPPGSSTFGKIASKLKVPGAWAAGKFGARGLGLAGGLTVGSAIAIPAAWDELVAVGFTPHGRSVSRHGHPLLNYWASQEAKQQGGMTGMSFAQTPSNAIQNVLNRYAEHKLSGDRAEMLLRRLPGTPGNPIHIDGHATLDITTWTEDSAGLKIRTGTHRGVPVKLWQDQVFPSKQGKPGKR